MTTSIDDLRSHEVLALKKHEEKRLKGEAKTVPLDVHNEITALAAKLSKDLNPGGFLAALNNSMASCRSRSAGEQAFTEKESQALGHLWGPLGAYHEDDDILGAALGDWMRTVMFKDMDFLNLQTWFIRWGQFGMPTLRLTDKQFSSFALSEINHSGEWKMPWPAMSLPVPEGLLNYEGNKVRRVTCLRANKPTCARLFKEGDNVGYVFRLDAGPFHLWKRSSSEGNFKGMLEDDKTVSTYDLPTSSAEDAARLMGVTALINAVDFINSGYKLERIQKKSVKSSKDGKPHAAQYRINVPVQINTTQLIRDYVSGGAAKQKFTARWVVRGHKRNQAHGPGRKERKSIWVEPYWKGPEAGATKIRDHVLKKA